MSKIWIFLMLFVVANGAAYAQDDDTEDDTPEPLTVSPAGGRVIDIAIAPDDSTFVTVSASVDRDGFVTDSIIEQWDVTTGDLLATVEPELNALYARYSPDGSLVGIGYSNGTITIHDAETLEETLNLPAAFGGDGDSFVFSVDNTLLVGSASTGSVWDLENGERIADLRGADNQMVSKIALRPDSATVATLDFASNLNFHDPATGEITASMPSPQEFAEYFVWLDETRLLIGGRQTLDVYDIETETVSVSFGVEEDTMIAIAIYEGRVLTSTFGGQVILWDLETGEMIETINAELSRGPQDVALGATVALTNINGVTVWPLANPLELPEADETDSEADDETEDESSG
jgi:WD40 repeat protein